jgi:hypothetical protein
MRAATERLRDKAWMVSPLTTPESQSSSDRSSGDQSSGDHAAADAEA